MKTVLSVKNQGSGKKGSRTSDHLMIIKYLIDKHVKTEKKKLYACFVDIKKAYDCTSRELLFYRLLTEYGIGGNFLQILNKMYENHEVYVKVSDGLLQPIKHQSASNKVVEFHPCCSIYSLIRSPQCLINHVTH